MLNQRPAWLPAFLVYGNRKSGSSRLSILAHTGQPSLAPPGTPTRRPVIAGRPFEGIRSSRYLPMWSTVDRRGWIVAPKRSNAVAAAPAKTVLARGKATPKI